MNWYIAKIIFGISAERRDLNQFDEQFRPRLKELEAKFKAMRTYNDFYIRDEIESVMWPEFKKHPRSNNAPTSKLEVTIAQNSPNNNSVTEYK